jgi:hypothetical protein
MVNRPFDLLKKLTLTYEDIYPRDYQSVRGTRRGIDQYFKLYETETLRLSLPNGRGWVRTPRY